MKTTNIRKLPTAVLLFPIIVFLINGCTDTVEDGLPGKVENTTANSTYHPAGWRDNPQHEIDYSTNPQNCKACHGNDLQGGSSGVSCEGCHHSGWIGGSHAGENINTCIVCHESITTCEDCHHTGWTGEHGVEYSKAPADCEECHGADLTGGTSGKSCVACHDDNLHHTEGEDLGCDTPACHAGGGGEGCDDCHGHDAGEVGTYVSHSTHTENDDDDLKGPNIVCSDCHDTNNYPYFKSGTGTAPYDLSETNVCDTCHSPNGAYNGITSSGDSIGAKTNWVNAVYDGTLTPGKEKWCAGCHDNVPAVVSETAPDICGDNATYGYYFLSIHDTQIIECVDCHDFSPAVVPHGGQILEEALCEDCHDGDGPATDNIQAQIDKANAHPTDDYSGRHNVSESTTSDMDPNRYSDAQGNRHAECVDCHNPHAAGATAHTMASGGNAVTSDSPLYKVSGVEPPITGAWVAPNFADIDEIPASTGITKEYQLCFKCHSNWTDQPAGQTNIAKQFNPANASAHPVEKSLDDSSSDDLQTYQLNAEWRDAGTGTETMYCSDCHGSETSGDPAGPHGSDTGKILKERYWPKNSSGVLWTLGDAVNGTNNFNNDCLCKKCHPMPVHVPPLTNYPHYLASVMGVHDFECVKCHVGLPHGYHQGRLIGNMTDPAPYNYETQNEVSSFNKRSDPNNYVGADCVVPDQATACPFGGMGAHPS